MAARAVPVEWTDIRAPDPVIVIGAGRTCFVPACWIWKGTNSMTWSAVKPCGTQLGYRSSVAPTPEETNSHQEPEPCRPCIWAWSSATVIPAGVLPVASTQALSAMAYTSSTYVEKKSQVMVYSWPHEMTVAPVES